MNIELREEFSTPNPEDAVILAARGDHMEESLVGKSVNDVMEGTNKSKQEFLEDAIRRGHWGIFEHPQAFFVAEDVDVVTERQVARHRHMSFDIQSMRYNDFDDADFSYPPENSDRSEMGSEYAASYYTSLAFYKNMKEEGEDNEDARYVLPLGTTVNMSFSGNIRSLLHFLDLRRSGAAQWGAREFAEQIYQEMLDWCPTIVEEWEEHAANSSLTSP